ncbi:GrpB family protein [Pseudooceanicola sp. MF1-13]|uniref:GrpB family protein n=1 Tax=Pseudooceanicola sp. MF1-13 TaxID=3379095 RepID=UPI003891EA42
MTIRLCPYDPRWTAAFADEADAIRRAYGATPIQLHHIGSTAIPGIVSKPIIDILGEVPNLSAAEAKAAALAGLGYESMGAYGLNDRRYFRKTDASGARTHHLHLYVNGSAHVTRHIAFRDYLITHSDAADAYSTLKAQLAQGGGAQYQDGKAPFVRRVEAVAVEWASTRTIMS